MSHRTLLHIDSSILGDHSVSRTVSAAVVANLRAGDPSLSIIYRDLASTPLPHATPSSMPADHPLSGGAGDAVSQQALDEFLARRHRGDWRADVQFHGADAAARLDRPHHRARQDLQRYGANGAEGLAGDKRVIVALSRGGILCRPGLRRDRRAGRDLSALHPRLHRHQAAGIPSSPRAYRRGCASRRWKARCASAGGKEGGLRAFWGSTSSCPGLSRASRLCAWVNRGWPGQARL